MANITRILKRRSNARKQLHKLADASSHVFVIHYSCESFYDTPDGRSARITSIAVRNLASGQTSSFSIHQIAEKENVVPDKIEEQYDILEARMLNEFHDFVANHKGYDWIHWNMRDVNYGFEAIAHRARVLSETPQEIPEERRHDLARYLIDMYGKEYAGHPRLKSLMEINRISSKDALSGAEEAQAFTDKKYVVLHMSTLRKVDVMASIFRQAVDGTLITLRKWSQGWPYTIVASVELVKTHWIISLVSIAATVIGAIAAIYGFMNP